MENVYYWVGFLLVWLFIITGTIGLIYLFLSYMVERMKDNVNLYNYLNYKQDFKLWYYKIRKKK
jgi:hypothetical protein